MLAEVRAVLASMPDVTIFRNNTGSLRDSRGIPVRFGLAVGSADLIGSLRLTLGCCVGSPGCAKTFARALAIEVKKPGEKPTKDQAAWLSAMKTRGWITGWTDSVRGAIDIIEAARRWEL